MQNDVNSSLQFSKFNKIIHSEIMAKNTNNIACKHIIAIKAIRIRVVAAPT